METKSIFKNPYPKDWHLKISKTIYLSKEVMTESAWNELVEEFGIPKGCELIEIPVGYYHALHMPSDRDQTEWYSEQIRKLRNSHED